MKGNSCRKMKLKWINNQQNSNRITLPEVAYLLSAAFVILLFATRSSFLYPLNDWNDANSYFSVGKALFNGLVPYRDVFDQKGMYLYFFYGLSYLVSHTTFTGVFVLEIICGLASLLGFYRIICLYSRQDIALILSPFAYAALACSKSFYWGGSAEELCMPFYIWGLYIILKYSVEWFGNSGNIISAKSLIIAGVLAGMIANIKFTGLGFFFAWMAWVFFTYVIDKRLADGLKACLWFLLGMAIPFIPWLIYFGVRGELYSWYWGYVYINVFSYSNLDAEGPSFGMRIYELAKNLYWIIRDNFTYFALSIPGVIYIITGSLIKKNESGTKAGIGRRIYSAILLPVLFGFLYLGIYVGGSVLAYYALPLSVFGVCGVILLARVIEIIMPKTDTVKWYLAALSILLCCILVYGLSMNSSFMKVNKEDHFLYKLKAYVEDDATLLNVGCLDAGLYTVCDIVPSCQWFQTQTINSDVPYDEQARYISEGLITYVLARDTYPECMHDKYELVDTEVWNQGDEEFTYYLFELRDK